MKEMMKSQVFKIAALAVAFVLVALISFLGGIKVGSYRALFSCRWGENYANNFMGPNHLQPGRGDFIGSMMNNPEGRDFRNAHGLSGMIISIAGNNLMVKDRDGKENTVAVTDKTIIKSQLNNLKISDLKVNDKIVIMGRPDSNGVVDADLIRVFSNLPPIDQNNNLPVAPDNNQSLQNNNQ